MVKKRRRREEESNICVFCGEELDILPYTCKFCGGNFCAKHRVPESHNCIGLEEYKKGKRKELIEGKAPISYGNELERKERVEKIPFFGSSHFEKRYPHRKRNLAWIWSIFIIIILVGLVYAYNSGFFSQFTNMEEKTNLISTSIGDIVKNPETYYNTRLTINGVYDETLGGDYLLIDEQGYKLKIKGCEEENRILSLGNSYKATGIISFLEKCFCQERFVMNITQEEWDNFIEEFWSKNGILIYKENVSLWNGNYLLLPSSEEGWYTLSTWEKVEVSNCQKNEVFEKSYPYEIRVNETHILKSTTEVIKESRCEPNSIERVYYLKCTEPMIKIS
jgi:hypothetical protein